MLVSWDGEMDAGHLLTPSSNCGGEGEGENSQADKGSEEQLGIGERRAISAFRLCFLHIKLLSPSHTEGETTICLFVASLYFEVLEAGPCTMWPLLLILGMVMKTE